MRGTKAFPSGMLLCSWLVLLEYYDFKSSCQQCSCLELHLLLEVLHNTIKVIDLSLLVLILFIYLIG